MDNPCILKKMEEKTVDIMGCTPFSCDDVMQAIREGKNVTT